MDIYMKLKDKRTFLLSGAFLLFLLLFAMMSSVAAADDNSQVVCENCNDNVSLAVEVNNADVMEFNNTHDKIVIENVIKEVVVISNSTSSSVCIVNSTIGTIIISNSKIYDLTLWNSKIMDLSLEFSKIYDLTLWNSTILNSIINNSKIYDFSLKNSKFYDLTLRNSITLKASFEKSIIHILTVSNSTDVIDLAESKSVRPTPIFGSDSDGSNTRVEIVKKRSPRGEALRQTRELRSVGSAINASAINASAINASAINASNTTVGPIIKKSVKERAEAFRKECNEKIQTLELKMEIVDYAPYMAIGIGIFLGLLTPFGIGYALLAIYAGAVAGFTIPWVTKDLISNTKYIWDHWDQIKDLWGQYWKGTAQKGATTTQPIQTFNY